MEKKRYAEGLVFAGSSFVIWGLLPLYWKLVQEISPYVVFCNRVVWSFVFVIILLAVSKKLPEFRKIIKTPRSWLVVLAPAVFISVNWILYIWAVSNGHVVECSLGYFINPLVLTILGRIFLKEKLTKYQLIGIIFAGIGVLIKAVAFGRVPLIGLGLAASFGLYGLYKKKSPLNSINGLGLETLLVGVPALGYMLFAEICGGGVSGNVPFYYWLLMIGGGVVTAIPLLLYGEGTKRLPLAAVGFLQYIAPILMLLLGVFAFGEPFEQSDVIPFVFIWIGLVFFSYSQYKLLSKKKI